MSVLQLTNIPDEVYRRLERLAQQERRTPSEAAVRLLTHAVAQADTVQAADVRKTLDWIRANRMTPTSGTPDSLELLREDRSR